MKLFAFSLIFEEPLELYPNLLFHMYHKFPLFSSFWIDYLRIHTKMTHMFLVRTLWSNLRGPHRHVVN